MNNIKKQLTENLNSINNDLYEFTDSKAMIECLERMVKAKINKVKKNKENFR